jgi:two-component system, NtrC family, response regulator HydG
MPELVFFRRGEEVLRYVLDRPRVVLGRGDKSDLVIPDPEVSRQQVALVAEDGRYVAQDLSGKGTFVGGSVQQYAALVDGADIALGQWRAVFRERSAQTDGAVTEVGERGTELHPAGASASSTWQPAQLRIRQGANEQVRKLSDEPFSVGKDDGNDLVLADHFVSGKHLRVERHGNAFRVTDLRSTNGTFVGAMRLLEAEVPLGTTLRLGEIELTLENATKVAPSFEGMIGTAPAVRQLAELIDRVAPSNAAVAIFGESGTGKELVARAVHARSARADKIFIPVNCAAISKELIESELVGHEKGAFTGAINGRKGAFEEADGGTLFLDEIGELPMDLQAKLLRALESGEIKRVGASRPIHVDVRVVTATNRDLFSAAREGRFREDLYYRLCVIPLHLPPLRRRTQDVVALAEHFLRAFTPRGQNVALTPGAVERLKTHAWPGNIRELRNVVHRSLLLRKGPMIEETDLAFDAPSEPTAGHAPTQEYLPGHSLQQMLERLEREIVESALRKFSNNRERVAKELGVARSTLFKRLKDWGLTRQDEHEAH